jgi:hypothetical protein
MCSDEKKDFLPLQESRDGRPEASGELDQKTCVIGTPAPPSPERVAQARAAAIEAGQRIAKAFPDLDRRTKLGLATAFRRQLIPRGKPGRRRSKEITAAHADLKSGVRGLALYRKHIAGFDRMNRYKRESCRQSSENVVF